MTVYVVDASVAAKWIFEEVHTNDALRLLDNRNQLHAPDFFLVEVSNVVCKRIRRKEISDEEGHESYAALRQFPVRTHSFSLLLDPAFEIAIRTKQSLYDCLYIALATLIGGYMVTADRRLYNGLAGGPFSNYVHWLEDIT